MKNPTLLSIRPSATKEAAEKSLCAATRPSAAEAAIDYTALTARLKPCPFERRRPNGFFQQPVKAVGSAPLTAQLKRLLRKGRANNGFKRIETD